MKRIVITTESGTDLPAERAQALDIRIIPMWVVTEGRSRQDGSFPAGEVFTYYKKTKTVPSTSAVNPQEYMEFFKELRREKPDADILHIAYSSKASSTWQNASIAIKELNDPGIFLADSLNVSGGISLICEKAAQIAGRAADGKAALEELESWIRRARVTFLPDSLEFLKAGGRVSNAAYLGADPDSGRTPCGFPEIQGENGCSGSTLFGRFCSKQQSGPGGSVPFLYRRLFNESSGTSGKASWRTGVLQCTPRHVRMCDILPRRPWCSGNRRFCTGGALRWTGWLVRYLFSFFSFMTGTAFSGRRDG